MKNRKKTADLKKTKKNKNGDILNHFSLLEVILFFDHKYAYFVEERCIKSRCPKCGEGGALFIPMVSSRAVYKSKIPCPDCGDPIAQEMNKKKLFPSNKGSCIQYDFKGGQLEYAMDHDNVDKEGAVKRLNEFWNEEYLPDF